MAKPERLRSMRTNLAIAPFGSPQKRPHISVIADADILLLEISVHLSVDLGLVDKENRLFRGNEEIRCEDWVECNIASTDIEKPCY